MKKILALLFALSMLLALVACGGAEQSIPDSGASIPSSDTPASSGVPTSTGSSEGISQPPATTAPSATLTPATQPPVTTAPPATKAPATQPPVTQAHTHSYTSKVTTAATCGKEGIKTFTCSCGNTYTEKIAATGHTWSSWKVETYALVGRAGTEIRTCSVCSVSEKKDSTANEAFNSFFDWGLEMIISNNYGSINASTLLEYACCTFDEYIDKPVSSATIFAALSERFDIDFTDTLKSEMKEIGKWRFGYDEASDTFTLYVYASDPGEFKLLGYVHNGGNKYTTYYSFTPHEIDTTLNFAVELEYNKLNGNPNKYLSIGRVDALPSNMICISAG